MKKILKLCALTSVLCALFAVSAHAYQLVSQRELGQNDAKNQNVTVTCTTDAGKISNQTCSFRRYAKCTTAKDGKKNCTGWHMWQDLRSPGTEYADWRAAATACCRAKGLR